MLIDRLETHDRFQHFTNQAFDIGKTCQKIIDERPFGDHAFYIFTHKREIALDERISIFNEDLHRVITPTGALLARTPQYHSLADVPTARIIWQPRLTKPQAQENSMLFKAYPGTDEIKVIWMIPDRPLWDQYTKGKMLENKTVSESIHDFLHNKDKLEARDPDDLPDWRINEIYKEISREANKGGRLGI